MHQRFKSWADTVRPASGAARGSRSPYAPPLNVSASSKYLQAGRSTAFIRSPTSSPAASPIPIDTPTQTKAHPALSALVIVQLEVGEFCGQRVGRSTEQLQQVLMTVGAIRRVPSRLTSNMPSRPRLSRTHPPFSFGSTRSKNTAETNPARSPQAIAAPMLMQILATDPQTMAPEMVPTSDPLTPSFPLGLSSTEQAQLAMTEALRARKVEMKASCLISARYVSELTLLTEYLAMRRGEVVQKARKRKKVPRCAVTDELLVLLNSGVLSAGGGLRRRLATIPQQAAKRQMLVIWQSSMMRTSGDLRASKAHRKQLRFQQKLNPIEFMMTCPGFSLPNNANAETSWAMVLARTILKLQQSTKILVPHQRTTVTHQRTTVTHQRTTKTVLQEARGVGGGGGGALEVSDEDIKPEFLQDWRDDCGE